MLTQLIEANIKKTTKKAMNCYYCGGTNGSGMQTILPPFTRARQHVHVVSVCIIPPRTVSKVSSGVYRVIHDIKKDEDAWEEFVSSFDSALASNKGLKVSHLVVHAVVLSS